MSVVSVTPAVPTGTTNIMGWWSHAVPDGGLVSVARMDDRGNLVLDNWLGGGGGVSASWDFVYSAGGNSAAYNTTVTASSGFCLADGGVGDCVATWDQPHTTFHTAPQTIASTGFIGVTGLFYAIPAAANHVRFTCRVIVQQNGATNGARLQLNLGGQTVTMTTTEFPTDAQSGTTHNYSGITPTTAATTSGATTTVTTWLLAGYGDNAGGGAGTIHVEAALSAGTDAGTGNTVTLPTGSSCDWQWQ